MIDESALKIVKMRSEGMPMQEIADFFGVSRQTVSNILREFCGVQGNDRFSRKRIQDDENIIYPNIAKWMDENHISYSKLEKIFKQKDSAGHTGHARKKLYGEMAISVECAKRLLEYSGKTFEYMFAERDNIG